MILNEGIKDRMRRALAEAGGVNDNGRRTCPYPSCLALSGGAKTALDLRAQLDQRLDVMEEAARITFWWRVQAALNCDADALSDDQLRYVIENFNEFVGHELVVVTRQS